MSTLDKIKNPATGKWVNLSGKKGKYVLENYLDSVNMLGGARLTGKNEQYIDTILQLVKKTPIGAIPLPKKRAILFVGKDAINDIKIRNTINKWTKKDLDTIFRMLSLKIHPDHNSNSDKSKQAFQFLREVYDWAEIEISKPRVGLGGPIADIPEYVAPTAQAAPKPAPKPAPKAAPKPAPRAEPKPAPRAEPKPVPRAEPKPAPKPAPQAAPKPAPKPAPQAAPKRSAAALRQDEMLKQKAKEEAIEEERRKQAYLKSLREERKKKEEERKAQNPAKKSAPKISRTAQVERQRKEEAMLPIKNVIEEIESTQGRLFVIANQIQEEMSKKFLKRSSEYIKEKKEEARELLKTFKEKHLVKINRLAELYPDLFDRQLKTQVEVLISNITESKDKISQMNDSFEVKRAQEEALLRYPASKNIKLIFNHSLSAGNDLVDIEIMKSYPAVMSLRESIEYCAKTPECGGFTFNDPNFDPTDLDSKRPTFFKRSGTNTVILAMPGATEENVHAAYVKM